MLRERDPFGRALARLRSDLRSGVFAPGRPLTIVELARDLNLSPTPVREALSRLAGEGLVEERRGQGYFSWRIDTIDLVELFDLDALQVGAALQGLQQAKPEDRLVPPTSDPVAPFADRPASTETTAGLAEALFAWIVRLGGGRALSVCHARLSDRLGPARRAEAIVLPDLRHDLLAMRDMLEHGLWPDLVVLHRDYHERRRKAAPLIVAAMRRHDVDTALF